MKLTKTFENAIRGIVYCLKNERNMRIHVVVAFYVILLSFFLGLSSIERALIFATISAVLSAEMFNTAIERIVDLIVADYNSIIKIIKDIAAGAVFITTVFAVGLGLILLCKIENFMKIYQFFTNNCFLFLLFLVSLYISFSFIVCGKIRLKIFETSTS